MGEQQKRFKKDNKLAWLLVLEEKEFCQIVVKIFFRDLINVCMQLQGEKVYMKVPVDISCFLLTTGSIDTNKSFRMFHPTLCTVHQTALRVEREEDVCITQMMSEEEQCVGDLCLV